MNKLEMWSNRFRRAVIGAKQTFILSDCESSIQKFTEETIPKNILDHDICIVYFPGAAGWNVISEKEVTYLNNLEIERVSIDEIISATIDLVLNRDKGFIPGIGMRWITFKLKSGSQINVEFESGSTATASLSFINSLIAENQSGQRDKQA